MNVNQIKCTICKKILDLYPLNMDGDNLTYQTTCFKEHPEKIYLFIISDFIFEQLIIKDNNIVITNVIKDPPDKSEYTIKIKSNVINVDYYIDMNDGYKEILALI